MLKMVLTAESSIIIVGILFAALVILLTALAVNHRGAIGGVPYAIATLRRSVKAHEIGVYSGIYSR